MPDVLSAMRQREKEQRRAQRAPILVRVECKTPRIYIQAQGENISETGMLITCRETLPVSQSVTLRFALPLAAGRNVAVSTAAVVVRVERGRCMGVRFVGLRVAFQQAIAEYIERTGGLPALSA